MPCGCGKKNSGTVHFMGAPNSPLPDSEEWGPIVWKYLHCLAEKLGQNNNKVVDQDQGNYMETIITTLYLVLPCTDCQAHAASYLATNPFPSLKGLYGDELRRTVRNWLFDFHNAVRQMKGQPIEVQTAEECAQKYAGCFVPKCEYTLFVQNVAFAVRQGWVRIENWRKWYSNSERIRILSGNVVI